MIHGKGLYGKSRSETSGPAKALPSLLPQVPLAPRHFAIQDRLLDRHRQEVPPSVSGPVSPSGGPPRKRMGRSEPAERPAERSPTWDAGLRTRASGVVMHAQ